MTPSPARQDVYFASGVRTPFTKVDGPLAGLDAIALSVPVVRHMLGTLAGAPVAKRRHHVRVGAHLFEVDEFEGDNAGLVVAEIELGAVDEAFQRPAWLGREVSHLARYYNLNLATHPYARWSAAERAGEDV